MSAERGYLCVPLGCYCHDQNDVTPLAHGMGPLTPWRVQGLFQK